MVFIARGAYLILATLVFIAADSGPTHSQSSQLEGFLQHWQQRLNLQEWQIKVFYARQVEIGADMLGDIEYYEKTKTAVIRVLDPAEHPNTLQPEEAVRDAENTVLHELVHLTISRLTPPADSDAEERAVASLTEALMESRSAGTIAPDAGSGSPRWK